MTAMQSFHDCKEACLVKTMTIRNVPPDVSAWLGSVAEAHRASLNSTVVAILTSAAFPKRKSATEAKRDMSDLFGAWSDKEADDFNKTIDEAFGKIDAASWSAGDVE